ncbi:MAG TPA: penicillin-binding protein [Fibrobacteraceae bacterium]|nr:penicillin-binding protein [Fibrobacteraceae bacterium]
MKPDRINVLLVGLCALWALMFARTFQIQVLESNQYEDRADSQSQRRILWKPERGNILDRDGYVLATNQPFWNKTSMAKHRIFPEGAMACQLLGYTGRDGQGLQGLEYAFDKQLRGIDGWSYLTVDAQKKPIPGMERQGREPVPGVDLILTIQHDYQEIVENALAKGVSELDADRGSALLLDPNTGEILAMASWPGFDPNQPGNARKGTIRNDLISLVYEPGSTFKVVTASAALEEKSISPTQLIDGEGGRMALPNGEVIRDTKDHGMMNMTDAMVYSSNIAYAKIAKTLGNEKFYRYARSFGFGSPTMIESPGEESGSLKPIHMWSARTLMTMAFGHEIMATPLQVAMAYAAIANGGELLQPRIVKELRDPASGAVLQSSDRKVIRRVISQETAAKVRSMLREVVERGTAKNIRSKILDFAGKTGTAEKYSTAEGKYDRSSMISSFVGMVPSNSPRFLCMVVVDEPRSAHVGAYTAGPIFKEIMERIYYHPKVSPIQYHLAQVQGFNPCEAYQYIGLSQASANDLAKKQGCFVTFQGRGPQVIAQRLGSVNGESTSLLLTMGNMGTHQMPDLRGLSLRDALDALGPARSSVQVAGKGWVAEQEPLPNTPLTRGQSLRLVLKEKT